ncbi:MAG: ATP-binding protein [Reichenbachiella sp.]|uniref:sensor histidine kinase n=1 Tax=Reichenbachiella sp. TaxID=2184521 RepID=UPI003266DC7B
MSLIKLAVVFLVIRAAIFSSSFAQVNEKGLPFIDYYAPSDYRAGSFNFNVIRDSLGIYYFSNDDGVLVYNGLDWNLIRIADEKTAFWLQQDSKGTIYVGATGEFGYLKSSESGRMSYVSLMDKLDTEYHEFGVVWEVACTSRETIFRSKKYIFRLVDDEITVFHPTSKEFDVAFTVRDTVYSRDVEHGLVYFSEEGMHRVPGGEIFADMKVNIFLPYGDKLLVGSRYDGLYLVADGKVEVFQTEADDFLKKYKIYHGCVTYDGNYAFAAYTKGVVVLDPSGKQLQMLDETSGLIDYQYLFVGMYDANNLWIANGVGTSKVKVLSPLSYFDRRRGLIDVGSDIIRYKGSIYASTLRALYKLDQSPNAARFSRFNQQDFNEVYSLDLLEDKMLIATQKGLITYDNSNFEVISPLPVHYAKVARDQTKIFCGTGEIGLGVYLRSENGWNLIKLSGMNEPINKVVEINDKIVFMTKYGTLGVVSIKSNNNMPYLKLEEQYSIGSSDIVLAGDRVLVVSRTSSFFLDDENQIVDQQPLRLSNTPAKIKQLVGIGDGKYWLSYQDNMRINYNEHVTLGENGISATGLAFGSHFHVSSSFADTDDVIWFIGDGGVVRYDQKIPIQNPNESFKCHIDKMIWGKDSLIFENGFNVSSVKLPYDKTDIRFTFFTNENNAAGETSFQYRLVGREGEWSDWSREFKKDYTDLSAGEYIFHVRAKNAINQISEVDAYHFFVQKPWYLTNWSIFGYIVFLVALVYGIFKIRMTSLEQAKNKLEKLISKRTAEVEAQKRDIEVQRLVLQNANDTKNQLFSIIGHDLRSPLNSLQGLTDLIHHYQVEQQPEMVDEMVNHMADSVKRLRHLLDNLLTWAMNQSGNFKINPELIKIDYFLQEIVSVLKESAKSKKINIELRGSSGCLIHADRNSLSTVIRNLINNAIKFSQEGSAIYVEYSCDHQKTTIKIIDHGVGISSDKLEEIFELTHSTYGTNNEKGTGLGLVLVNEFVALNDGSIHVSSELGSGTTFTLEFPNK